MSTSMVSTVLDIEREAEAVLVKAEQEAVEILAAAKRQREENSQTTADTTKTQIERIDEKAGLERAAKVKELSASGEAALSAVRNISDAAFDAGVKYVMDALSGK